MNASEIMLYKSIVDVACIAIGASSALIFGVLFVRLVAFLRNEYED